MINTAAQCKAMLSNGLTLSLVSNADCSAMGLPWACSEQMRNSGPCSEILGYAEKFSIAIINNYICQDMALSIEASPHDPKLSQNTIHCAPGCLRLDAIMLQ